MGFTRKRRVKSHFKLGMAIISFLDKLELMKWVSFIPAAYRRTIIRAAQKDSSPVYLSGAIGSGKSAIARWIHGNSPRGASPLILFSSGDDLTQKVNEVEEGTLVIQDLEKFSDSDRSQITQLLRFRSLSDPTREGLRSLVRARIILTGSNPLDDFSSFAPFFKDFQIHLPSLDERGAEFEDIVNNLLIEMAHELKRDHVREISSEALAALKKHPWRAGLRELRNILRYGILRTKTARIEDAHLPNLRDPDGILLESRQGFLKVEADLICHSKVLPQE